MSPKTPSFLVAQVGAERLATFHVVRPHFPGSRARATPDSADFVAAFDAEFVGASDAQDFIDLNAAFEDQVPPVMHLCAEG